MSKENSVKVIEYLVLQVTVKRCYFTDVFHEQNAGTDRGTDPRCHQFRLRTKLTKCVL